MFVSAPKRHKISEMNRNQDFCFRISKYQLLNN